MPELDVSIDFSRVLTVSPSYPLEWPGFAFEFQIFSEGEMVRRRDIA